ncbi:hypothetical protein P175DRAFT_0495283 [Aspergillus ochraceoroseus IBT 24754]|uniref:Uncharacterized protein n=2 Tax=Aspergillus ochraceoroseus TaxID=138278 RepID=A0A2T5LRN4_9EURO|nr:uncharacterized protein P175DRAFT_0495283 [Aspergillus ochraceoroseus IBT 24754]KKK13157.1 hypothetical protein AOCH_003581 [Aspergillus ochraceoroseus]PTU18944.1 hypothetical protein P175DRAFT_0495283 [Aspergillus ochraceoroseus IBT 24754]
MSTLSPKYQQYLSMADDIQPSDPSSSQLNSENISEVMRFIQTHVSSQGSSHSSGAREMIKAGQRRIRLALRNKKGADPKIKTDETSRHMLALQQEGYLTSSLARKPGHKSADSTASTSRSVSSLSFKSNPKRDVETIGQPWLEDPLEERHSPSSNGSQVSSLDLRDLASFVEAAVNFSCQPESLAPSEHNSLKGIEQPLGQNPASPTRPGQTPRPPAPLVTKPNTSVNSGLSSSSGNNGTETSTPSQPSESRPANILPNTEFHEPLEDVKSKEETRTLVAKFPQPSAGLQSSSAPTTPALKLFPDTMPPRISSKGALRIPNTRAPTPHRPMSGTSTSVPKVSAAAVSESKSRETKVLSHALPKIQEAPREAHNEDLAAAERQECTLNHDEASPVQENFPQAKNIRRSSSLPMETIEAFPLPAPLRPLPTVPKPELQDLESTNLISSEDKQPNQREPKQSDLDPPFEPSSKIRSSKNAAENDNSSLHARVTPSPRLVLGAKEPAIAQSRSAETDPSGDSGSNPFVRTKQSRAERARSLRMQDLATNRIYLDGFNDSQNEERQSSESLREPAIVENRDYKARIHADRRCRREASSSHSSPPPPPPPSNPLRHSFPVRHNCTSPGSSKAETRESSETLPIPSSSRTSRAYRSSRAQSADTKRENPTLEPRIPDLSEAPLPSSDDEVTAGGVSMPQPRATSGRRRRSKHAPIVVDELPSHRGRSLKKHYSRNISPPTPQGRRKHVPGNRTHKHRSQGYQSYNSHDYQVPEPKPNPSLEGRIEHLERQNKILQAALLAALDVGIKQDLSSILGESTASFSTNAIHPLRGRSSSATVNTSASEEPKITHDRHKMHDKQERPTGKGKPFYRPESWIASPDSFGKDSYASEDSSNARELEDMIEEFDLNWESDNSPASQRTRIMF